MTDKEQATAVVDGLRRECTCRHNGMYFMVCEVCWSAVDRDKLGDLAYAKMRTHKRPI